MYWYPLFIQQYVENCCLRHGIKPADLIFPVTERAVQKQLHIVCDYLGYEGISTHSFRKWYATEIYKSSGYDIALVQRLLQHSSTSATTFAPSNPCTRGQVVTFLYRAMVEK